MNYWIFQSTEKRFDLRKPDALVPGNTDDWDATRFRSYMLPGDIVFFWLAGPPDIRGIYGWGELISEPLFDAQDDSYGVKVVYRRRLAHRPSSIRL